MAHTFSTNKHKDTSYRVTINCNSHTLHLLLHIQLYVTHPVRMVHVWQMVLAAVLKDLQETDVLRKVYILRSCVY